MSWTLVGENAESLEGGTTGDIGLPTTGVVADDIMVLAIICDFSSIVINSAGWTTLAASGSTWVVVYKIMGSTPDTVVNLTGTSAFRDLNCVVQCWRGGDPDTPIDVTTPAANTTSSGMPAPPSITTATNRALVFAIGLLDDDDIAGSVSAPAGYTNLIDQDTTFGAPGSTVMMASREVATAGVESPGTFSGPGDDATAGVTIALRLLRPTIEDVDTDNDIRAGQQDVVVTGVEFGASDTGSANVEIGSTADYGTATLVSLSRDSWSSTSIQVDIPDNLFDTLTPGTLYMFVTNLAGDTSLGFEIFARRAIAWTLSASSNIAASGEDTTAQLTAPATKTTGDFGGGRIQDDENPGDAVSLALDEYREDEWSIEATADAESAIYEFRVLVDGNVQDTYTVTPTATVSIGPAPTTIILDLVSEDDTAYAPTVFGEIEIAVPLLLEEDTAHQITLPVLSQQEGYRWRNDDGSETTATWAQAQDTAHEVGAGVCVRLRVLTDYSGGGDPTAGQAKLQFKLASEPGSAWRDIT